MTWLGRGRVVNLQVSPTSSAARHPRKPLVKCLKALRSCDKSSFWNSLECKRVLGKSGEWWECVWNINKPQNCSSLSLSSVTLQLSDEDARPLGNTAMHANWIHLPLRLMSCQTTVVASNLWLPPISPRHARPQEQSSDSGNVQDVTWTCPNHVYHIPHSAPPAMFESCQMPMILM